MDHLVQKRIRVTAGREAKNERQTPCPRVVILITNCATACRPNRLCPDLFPTRAQSSLFQCANGRSGATSSPEIPVDYPAILTKRAPQIAVFTSRVASWDRSRRSDQPWSARSIVSPQADGTGT